MKPFIIGLCGRSCSGKSTIASEIEKSYPNILYIKQDKFTKLPYNSINWESPESLRNDRLIHSIKRLKNGLPTFIPSCACTEVFDRVVCSTDYVLVEGFLLFADNELYPLFDKRVWIDVSDKNLIERRITRAGNGDLDTINYIKNKLIPCSKKYEQLQKSRAHVIIDGNKNKNDVIEDFRKFVFL